MKERYSDIMKLTAEELVELAVNGNGPAFTALWDKNIESLRQFLKLGMKIKNDIDIDDICSRSFEKAFRQIRNYDPNISRFMTWLKVIAKNTALDFMAREERMLPKERTIYLDGETNSNSNVELIADEIPSPIDTIIKDEDKKANEMRINSLPETYREVVRKRLLDQMQYKEIAEATGLNVNTVKTRVARAKNLLSEMQKQDEE